MAIHVVDCCGYSCPEPVIMARKAMLSSQDGKLIVKVNSVVARDNVVRAAKSLGWKLEKEEGTEEFNLHLTK